MFTREGITFTKNIGGAGYKSISHFTISLPLELIRKRPRPDVFSNFFAGKSLLRL
jgi:hypothetical protein